MATPAELAALLAEAEGALHQLQIGQKTSSVSYEGKSVTFQQTDIYRLTAYIDALKEQIATATGAVRRRGPIYLGF